MAPSSSHMKPKMRTIIAKQTAQPGIFHVATSNNPIDTTLNEQLVRSALSRIDWKAIENEII